MRTLFIFDGFIELEKVLPKFFKGTDKLFLFPIISRDFIAEEIRSKAGQFCNDIEAINVAELINRTAESIKPLYLRLVAQLPHQVRHKGKNLKEMFALDNDTSAWWFSLIAEKNPYKSDSFNILVQLESAIRSIKEKKVDRLIFGCNNNKLCHALQEYARSSAIHFRIVPANVPGDMREKVLEFRKPPLLQSLGRLLYFIIKNSIKTAIICTRFRRKKIEMKTGDALLALLYYPAFDMHAADRGIFKNKQYAGLQDALQSDGRSITWLAIYTPNDSLTLRQSIRHAERFIKSGHSLFFLEEFSSFALQVKSLSATIRTAVGFLNAQKSIAAAHTFGDYNFYGIFKNDWYASFAGHVGYAGILHYNIFKRALSAFQAKKCLYFCEMQAWEKALISARNSLNCRTLLFGYQSGTVSEMLLMYFNDPEEITDHKQYALPKPDKILCNGMVPYRYLSESGWMSDRLLIGEAVRYDYLRKYVKSADEVNNRDQRSVMVVLSINPKESSSILAMACEALKGMSGIKLLVRPHPFLPFKKVLALLKANGYGTGFEVAAGPVEETLLRMKVVICGESSMCIEALALGNTVIVADVPEWINMSPFKHFESKQIVKVGSADELRHAIIDSLNKTADTEEIKAEAHRVVSEFFYFDPASKAPSRMMELLKA